MSIDGFEWTVDPCGVFKDQWEGHGKFLGSGDSRMVIRSTEEYVRMAEDLAKNHGGLLPCRFWLQRNGYSGIEKSLQTHPLLFNHIPQHKPQDHYKSPSEWVPIAEQIANKNGGILPNSMALQKGDRDHQGVNRTCARYPELFAHIPQEIRATGTSRKLVGIRLNGTIYTTCEFAKLHTTKG